MENQTEKATVSAAKKSITLPTDQVNTASVAVMVATNWASKPQLATLALSQITATNFLSLSEGLSNKVSNKRNLIGNYTGHTKLVGDLAAEIKQNGKVLKDYLFEQFKKEAKAHYTAFGFVHKKNSYTMPTDYDNFAQTLRTICDKINSPQYDFIQNKTYGKAYWETVRDKFQAAWNESRTQASQLTDITREIGKDMEEVKKILSLLRRRIKDDFAPDHESIYRSIGFLKESF